MSWFKLRFSCRYVILLDTTGKINVDRFLVLAIASGVETLLEFLGCTELEILFAVCSNLQDWTLLDKIQAS